MLPAVSAESVAWLVSQAKVPVWLPWPLPRGWLLTGLAYAGDERSGAQAAVIVVSGPAPFGGAGDMVLVAEQPGIGLGAAYAGLPGPDAGFNPIEDHAAPAARIVAAGHPTALWSVERPPDRAVFVGEAKGEWLWTVVWPETASLIVYDSLSLTDGRAAGHVLDLPSGALSPRLRPDPFTSDPFTS
jgi:hypothetical protein